MASTGKEAAAAEKKGPVDDDSLEDIFLRLDAADLARTSVACISFRGIITNHSFRRRFAQLHNPPPLVGFLEYEGPASLHPQLHPRTLHPRSLHHVSTPAGRAVAKAADFACAFLPDPGWWRIRDASGGRLLLSWRAATDFRDLMVCDPLHSTFVRVPPVPDHLIAGKHNRSSLGWFPFLVPLPASEKEEEQPIQVVWMLQQVNTVTGFVFSSSTWEWRRIPTFCLWIHEHPLSMSYRLYAHGCFYWTSSQFRCHSALKLDVGNMRFSTIQLPSVTQHLGRTNFIVEASQGNLGALVIGKHSLDLCCSSRTREGNGVDADADADWRHSRTVPLPDDSLYYSVVGAADGYMLLQAYPLLSFAQQTRQARYFLLKLKTLVFEELRVSFNKQLVFVHLYTNFPPLLSLPSMCNEEKTGRDQGMTGETSASDDGSRTISSTS